MTERVFEIRTEPHRAVIGNKVLLLEAEVIGAEFAQAYDRIRTVQQKVKAAQGNKASGTKHAKEADVSPATLVELSEAMREFISGFLLPDSLAEFAKMRLPDRVLVQLMEFAAELYGGGSGNSPAEAADAGGTSSA